MSIVPTCHPGAHGLLRDGQRADQIGGSSSSMSWRLPFIYAVILNKAIARERVTAEEWKKASETAHIVFPNRDSEWNAVLDRAVHNDFMYGALDASRAAGRIDQEYINPRDRKSTPWADQQWNMKKVATEAALILLGMRQDIQAKYHHGRAFPGDWADMPDRDDYMVRGVVSDPNRRAYDCLRAPGVRATLLNAQTGQCIPLDDPTWVPELASSHLLVGTITTILGRAWRMPMFHPQLMAATAMLEKLQKYFNALNEAVLGKRLGTAPFSMIAGLFAPELRTIPTREQMPDTLAQSAAEVMLSHVSALSHSGSSADRKEILGRDGNPFGKSWFWRHKGEADPEASSSGKQRTEPAPDRGAGSGKDDDETLPDIGKLFMVEARARLPTSKALPLRSTARPLPPMSTAGREMTEGSFPGTLRLTWRSRCLRRQRS